MATATSRISLDTPATRMNLPPLVTHVLPTHRRPVDLAPSLPLPRRVSSESQAPGRASPSPRISRRTPVPFLLEAFPAPPSHIPGTPSSAPGGGILASPSLLASTVTMGWLSSASPAGACTSPVSPPTSNPNTMSPCSPKAIAATLHNNPPPSSPPTGPLPPIPGPSTVTRGLFTAGTLQTAVRSASPALSPTESQRSQSRLESRPRLSLDSNEPVRSRRRQGSLSSLRNPVHPMGEQKATITGEPCPPPPLPLATSKSPLITGPVSERKSDELSRGGSVEILRPSLARVITSLPCPDGKAAAEDSIASIDMSDLNAIKSDNEGEGDEQASCPFPRCPLLPHSQTQTPSPIDPLRSGPSCGHAPRKPSKSWDKGVHVSSSAPQDMTKRDGAMSPEITQIISATPRSRKRSTTSRSRDSSRTRDRKDNSISQDVPPLPINTHKTKAVLATKTARLSGDDDGVGVSRGEEGNDSDSSLDLHTPLPQLMLRHGMLSPNSKLLPQPDVDSARLSIMSGVSNTSNASLMSTTSMSSKHPKDARDTLQRRVRHRDGKLLKGGIGLTTGLGWSDSEDEDAPSPLTRRLSTLALSRRPSSSSVASYRSTQSHPIARSISHSVLREVDEQEPPQNVEEFGHPQRSSLATRSLPSRSKPVSRVGSARSVRSSVGRYSAYSTSSVGPGHHTRAGSVSESSVYAASIASKPDSFISIDGTGLMPGIREQDDGITPTRAAFERSSDGSLKGVSSADVPHTPSSTASSGSLPFPPTPEGDEEMPKLQPVYDQDKVLPPLPPSVRGKYPSTLGLRSPLQRPRTHSNASSASNNSMLGVPPGDVKSRSTSSTSTPRQSVAERQAKTAIPTGTRRPFVNGTPRPSLTIPKSPVPSQLPSGGLPQPTSSLSSNTSIGQGYTPRPLRLASRSAPPLPHPGSPVALSPRPLSNQTESNSSSSKALQPGEQSPRPGQVLMYNRNVHDQLKLRALNANTGPNRTQAPATSPGGGQTVFISAESAAGPGPASVSASVVNGGSASPLPSPSPNASSSVNGEGFRPRPRTGTGMLYRNNLSVGSVAASRMRPPSTVPR